MDHKQPGQASAAPLPTNPASSAGPDSIPGHEVAEALFDVQALLEALDCRIELMAGAGEYLGEDAALRLSRVIRLAAGRVEAEAVRLMDRACVLPADLAEARAARAYLGADWRTRAVRAKP